MSTKNYNVKIIFREIGQSGGAFELKRNEFGYISEKTGDDLFRAVLQFNDELDSGFSLPLEQAKKKEIVGDNVRIEFLIA